MLCMAGQEGEEKPRSMVTPTGYWYSDHGSSSTPSHQNPSTIHQTHMVNHELQSFEPNSEIYNLTSGMEMIGFPPKNLHHHHHHHSDPSSSKNMTSEPSSNDFYNQHGFTKPEFNTTSETMMVLVDDDPSLRCVFPCEGNERPSQGLSLSLSSSNPSSIGLQSFELRHHQEDHRDIGFFGKPMNIQQQQQEMMNHHHQQQGYFQIRNSKYLGPAQELLNEFCSLGTKKNDHYNNSLKVLKPQQDENASTSSKKQLLQSIDFLELQKRKTKLLQMLEEVDRRYKHYCDQMKAVVSSFEAVAGNGAATVYSCLASKAMSRHFRSLRDGIVGQIKETKKAMGEKDYVSPGTTKGETPRLRILDQTLRQQKAFQQISMMESHPWRPQRGLPERSVSVLRAWLFEHFLHPYPSDVDKHILARQTGLSRSQVSNWFINARVRLWKPMVEEMYLEETKEQENLETPDACKALDHDMNSHDYDPHTQTEDQKPNLVRIDSECISSIINHCDKNDTNNSKCLQDHHNFQPHLHHQQAFGAIELDFSAGASGYNYGGGGSKNLGSGSGGGGGGGGVSLTLGLQQHGGYGMGLNFSQASQSTSLYYSTRDDIDQDCEQVNEYSLLDSENQNLPYRNLMGAQLLHDLAG